MYILNPRIAADLFDDEYIIANLDTGLYYSVQGMAVHLISKLPFEDVAITIKEIAALCIEETEDMITADIHKIWQQLVDEKLIKETDSKNIVTNNFSHSTQIKYIPSSFNRYSDMQDLLILDPIHDVDENGWQIKETEL